MFERRLLPILVLTCLVLFPPQAPAAPDTTEDQHLLRRAGVPTDTDGLLAFLRKLSPTEADHKHMAMLVHQLGSDRFEEREAASRQLLDRHLAALPALRRGLVDEDVEVVRRCQDCLDQIENGPGPQLPLAAVHLLGERRPPAAVPVLLDYLTHAGDLDVQDAVLDALVAVAARPGQVDHPLVAVLKDPVPLRRAAAAYVLGRSADDQVRATVRPLLADRRPQVRYRAAQGLLAGRDRAAVPALIDLLLEPPGEMTWRVEEMLVALAGDQAPESALNDSSAEREKLRDGWRHWWADRGAGIDLTRLDDRTVFLGLTLVPEMHANKVWEYDRGGRVLWTLSGLQCPIDAQVLPGGRLLVAELSGHRVTERDRTGKILWQKNVQTPIACQRLRNGQTFIGTNHRLCTVTPDGKETWSYAAENGFFIHSVQRLRNGHFAMVSMDGAIREIDAQGKEVRTLPLSIRGGWSGIEGVPGNRYLVVNNTEGRVMEVDAAGKTVWQHLVPGACFASRLPNGNTLVVSNSKGLVEVNRAGKAVTEKSMQTSLWRAHRR
jgi:hypothetical protein